MRLHPAQEKLLKLLKANISDPLSVRELQLEVQASSPSVIQYHLKQLEKKGYLRKNPSNPQDYQILKEPDSDVVYLNLYGMAQCGPNGQMLEGDPIDRVAIYSPLLGFSATEAFLVKARGNSMEPEIYSGDMIIARKSQEAPNESVVVCVNNNEVLVKKLQKIQDKDGATSYNLISLNPDFPPFLASENFHIEGIVRGVLKYTQQPQAE